MEEDTQPSKLDRRHFIQNGATWVAIGGGAGLSVPMFSKGQRQSTPEKPQGIDYSRAKKIPTICFGCTTHCGVIGYVVDGKVRRISGNPLDPNTKGKVCAKASGMIDYTYYPERLQFPIERVGPRGSRRWKRISWDEALDKIAGRLKKIRASGHPEHFIFHYGRDKTKGFTKRFTDAFGTPNRLNRRAICSSNRRVPNMSYFGRDFEWETQDLENSSFILNFGNNCAEAYQGGLPMIQRIQKARVDHGCRMITFEVRPSATANISDEYYPIFPGSDGAIAYAIANVLIDENFVDKDFWKRWVNVSLDEIKNQIKEWTPEWAAPISGLPADTIRKVARAFGKAGTKAVTISGRGSAKHYNGVGNDRGIRLLDILVGNIGRPGGLGLCNGRGWAKNRYGLWDLPTIGQPGPKPPRPKPWLPGTKAYENLPADVRNKVDRLDPIFRKRYYGELATPSEYPLSWHWYSMRVGQLVHPYIKEGRAKVELYMSYTYGAAYGYPEAKVCRDVLLDESLVPFHVAIDINFSEQAALADIVLPEATSLERWDAHSTNSYDMIPFTGIRQPLVKPLGEARSIQEILKDLAHRIGDGMEQYFSFDSTEDYYREWYRNVSKKFGSGTSGWEKFKKAGIWQDKSRPKDYELYERPVTESEISEFQNKSREAGALAFNEKGKPVGIVQPDENGNLVVVRGFPTPSRKIQVYDEIFAKAAASVGLPADDPNGATLPTWFAIPGFEELEADPKKLVLTTFKWNVHTQGRSGYWRYSAEIVHTNYVFIHPETADNLGLRDLDLVEVSVQRPKGNTYRGNIDEIVGTFKNRIKLLKGMHPRTLAFAHSVGHTEHGGVGRGVNQTTSPEAGIDKNRVPTKIWWAQSEGGPGNGFPYLNDALPINPSVLVGGQNWFDNICTIKRV